MTTTDRLKRHGMMVNLRSGGSSSPGGGSTGSQTMNSGSQDLSVSLFDDASPRDSSAEQQDSASSISSSKESTSQTTSRSSRKSGMTAMLLEKELAEETMTLSRGLMQVACATARCKVALSRRSNTCLYNIYVFSFSLTFTYPPLLALAPLALALALALARPRPHARAHAFSLTLAISLSGFSHFVCPSFSPSRTRTLSHSRTHTQTHIQTHTSTHFVFLTSKKTGSRAVCISVLVGPLRFHRSLDTQSVQEIVSTLISLTCFLCFICNIFCRVLCGFECVCARARVCV